MAYKEEIYKLNLIWDSIPNCKLRHSQRKEKISLNNLIPTQEIGIMAGKFIYKYENCLKNVHCLAMIMAQHIENSIKQEEVINIKEGKENNEFMHNGKRNGRNTTSNIRSEQNSFCENSTEAITH